MIIYPAIDMLDGQAVRLTQGRKENAISYGLPQEQAQRWAQAGAQWLHLVDLSAAFSLGTHTATAIKIARDTQLQVQLGGGIRTLEDIRLRLEGGIQRVILGTVALTNPDLVAEACALYPGRIVCGIDAKGGKVAVQGWAEQSDISPVDLARRMKQAGVHTIIFTDISKDGMLIGPNIQGTVEMAQETEMEVIGSGGVSSLEDILALKQAGVAGVIAGKALYEGRFTLQDALQAAQ